MGNKNSGRLPGKNLSELIQAACVRAVKQGKHGLAGQRELSELLAEQMQTDPFGFLRAVAPYVPKDVFIDHQISISAALAEAHGRVINMGKDADQLCLDAQAPEAIDLELVLDEQMSELNDPI